MSNKIKDESYSNLSFGVYEDELLEKNAEIKTKDGTYKVIDSIDNDSGLQAIAVVNKKDYKKIQIGVHGT